MGKLIAVVIIVCALLAATFFAGFVVGTTVTPLPPAAVVLGAGHV